MIRYVLYDHDTKELASRQVYAGYFEACLAADLLNNVTVLDLFMPDETDEMDEDSSDEEEIEPSD